MPNNVFAAFAMMVVVGFAGCAASTQVREAAAAAKLERSTPQGNAR